MASNSQSSTINRFKGAQWKATEACRIWNGSAFEEIPLPDDLPGPDIKFRKELAR